MNILIIGGGSIGQRHLKNLSLLGFKNLYCLKREKNPEFEQEFNCKVLTSYKEAELLDINCVFVCTPTSLHNEGLEYAVENNCHIFMEKPLIHDNAGLNEAKTLLKGYDKTFFIGFMLHFHPLVKKVKEIINSKELGKIYSARLEFGNYLPYWHPWEDYKTSYASKKELGGGVINTITHELDLVQYFFGKPKSIYCEAANFNILQIEVEELAEAIFTYDEKVVSLHIDYLQKDYDRNLKILFEQGSIKWDWHSNQIVVKKHKQEPEIVKLNDFDVNQLYIGEVKAFMNLIHQNNTKHGLDSTHAISNASLMLAMHQSATEKKRINLY